jgi:hypothetical protein
VRRRTLLLMLVAVAAIGAAPVLSGGARPQPGAARFLWVDVLVDSGDAPLAAYQIKLHDSRGIASIVGIEGGAHPLFAGPPYYDPEAMMTDCVIIAAYSIAGANELPKDEHRIARIHVRVAGDAEPEFDSLVQAAADATGGPIQISVTLKPGEAK